MRSILTFLILVSFAGMSVLSIVGMNPGHHSNGYTACVGSLTQGKDCPMNSPVDSVTFHLNSFKVFSTSLVSQSNTGVVLAWLVSILLAIFMFIFAPQYSRAVSFARVQHSFETSFQPFKQKRINWFSLHENSPSLVIRR